MCCWSPYTLSTSAEGHLEYKGFAKRGICYGWQEKYFIIEISSDCPPPLKELILWVRTRSLTHIIILLWKMHNIMLIAHNLRCCIPLSMYFNTKSTEMSRSLVSCSVSWSCSIMVCSVRVGVGEGASIGNRPENSDISLSDI